MRKGLCLGPQARSEVPRPADCGSSSELLPARLLLLPGCDAAAPSTLLFMSEARERELKRPPRMEHTEGVRFNRSSADKRVRVVTSVVNLGRAACSYRCRGGGAAHAYLQKVVGGECSLRRA